LRVAKLAVLSQRLRPVRNGLTKGLDFSERLTLEKAVFSYDGDAVLGSSGNTRWQSHHDPGKI
jgi:hypothetical protein